MVGLSRYALVRMPHQFAAAAVAAVAESLLRSPGLEGYLGWFEWQLLLIPPITGVIGYMTNWVAIRMLFHPLEFKGVDVPGLDRLTVHLPRRFRQIPGMMEGKLGWQGIIPSRARKMGSINVDTAIAKLTTQRELYERFDPERIAEHVATASGDRVREMVEETIREENPRLWANAPEPAREVVRSRVDARLPEISRRITRRIGENVDDLLDVKRMVIDHLGENPEDVNRIFLETGEREFRFLVNCGFYFGTLLGCVAIPLYVLIDAWWVLPATGVFVGYGTNWLAIKMIFRPMHPRDVGPFTLHGIFLRRQDEASETYAAIVAEDIITLENIADSLLYGPNADRTRQMVEEELRDAIDGMFGPVSPLVRVTTGDRQYEAIRESIATRGVEFAVEPMQDPALNEARSDAVQRLLAERMKELPPAEFAVMLRAAFREDEWLLVAVGAALGFVAGWIQLLVVTTV